MVAKLHNGPTAVPVELLTVTYHSYEEPAERPGHVMLVDVPERTPVLLARSEKLLPLPCMSYLIAKFPDEVVSDWFRKGEYVWT